MKVDHSPITNVFRVYNETSGEIYRVDRFNDNKIYFGYLNAPRVLSEVNEKVTFQTETNELLFVSTSLIVNTLKVFKIFLKNNTIIAATEDALATSFNSSLMFSNRKCIC